MRIDVIHGPNLNLLGTREPDVYGSTTLQEIDDELRRLGAELGFDVRCRQSNHEGTLVDWIQEAGTGAQPAAGIILNPAAYTHTSVAMRDALAAVDVPAVEVHLSNTEAREEFRRVSFVAGVVTGRIAGFGAASYFLALRSFAAILDRNN